MRNVLTGALIGAIFSAIILLFSGNVIRWEGAVPIITFMSIIGAAAYWGVQKFKSYLNIRYGHSRLINIAMMLLFSFALVASYFLARLGPFVE